jgi:hypothetical protein
MRFHAIVHSRALLVLGVCVAVAVPAITLPRLPHVSPWPALIGLVPFVVGKYLLCPLRWRAITDAGLTRWWHIRAYSESELLGLLTPGHVGADVWRMRRLTLTGMATGDAVASVAIDRFVGAIGLTAFVVFAGVALPPQMLVVAVGFAVAILVGAMVVRRFRPQWLAVRRWPSPRQLAKAFMLTTVYQLTIAAMLLGTVQATGHAVSPLALLGAFGATQFAGAVPGPNGASPREGALVVALVALGVPWTSAMAAVALKAALSWLPALALGGVSLIATRRMAGKIGLAASRAGELMHHSPA